MIGHITQKLTSYDSLALLREYFLQAKANDHLNSTGANTSPSDLDLTKSIIGMICLDKTDFSEIDHFQTNRHFQDALELDHLPSHAKISQWLANSSTQHEKQLRAMIQHLTPSAEQDAINNQDTLSLLQTFSRLCLQDIAQKELAPELCTAEASPFTASKRKQLDELGYMVIENVLSEEEVAQARDIVLRLAQWEEEQGCAHFYGNENRLQRIWNLLNKHEMFREVIQRPVIHQVMNHIFDRPTLHQKYVMHSWAANIVYKGGEAQMLHVDSAVPEPLPQWPVRANANFLLNDFTAENGASLVIPATHNRPDKPSPADEKSPDLIKVIAPKGAMVVWHGSLWHQSGQNNTHEPRIALLAGFTASHLKEMCLEEDYTKVVDQDIQDSASPLLKRLIGVDFGIKKGALQKPPQW
ncbi:phytanoyl-CoA dioxygenase family protein [Terasakiella sp. SH-1]|uniref:phytanoyl-CoA dioxygenase family protein n=1 Tax=Terasakiella sp. SH-1 TaxID=2560057 RepID=UPI0010744B94|nr:phytanoyl-CoA dioxygenase family protein [Terasakiella sp. SH-1]